jgi:hypothetical protein
MARNPVEWVGRGKTDTINPNPGNFATKEKAKPANANVVTTGFGVESGFHPPVPASRFVRPGCRRNLARPGSGK